MNLMDLFIVKNIMQQNQTAQTQTPSVDMTRPGPKEVYIAWQAPGRQMTHFTSEKMTRSFAIIGVIVALFLVILQEYFLILVIASLIFITQVLSKTPPEELRYEISSHGISIDGKMYFWPELTKYFFFNHDGNLGLAVDMFNRLPSRLFITILQKDQPKIKELLDQHLQFLEAEPESFLDRAYKSVTSKFNV